MSVLSSLMIIHIITKPNDNQQQATAVVILSSQGVVVADNLATPYYHEYNLLTMSNLPFPKPKPTAP